MFLVKLLYLGVFTVFKIVISPIYWIAVFLLLLQYKKVAKVEKKVLGVNRISTTKHIVYSSFMGIFGGLIGSILMLSLGISIQANQFKFVIILSLILMLINIRYICFSYSGGIIALSSLLFGFPKIDVSNLLSIVAILHIVESILIYIDGDRFKIPIFIKRGNETVGGFNLMKFWPLPLAVLIISSNSGFHIPKSFLFNNINPLNTLYILSGVVAVLGYGDISVSSYPDIKIKKSSKNLFIYSIILLFLSISSRKIVVLKYITSLFSFIAHEVLIKISKKKELEDKPLFTYSHKGVKILDVIPRGIGDKLGLKTGDVLISINDNSINEKNDILRILYYSPSYINVEYINRDNNRIFKDYYNKQNIKSLDVLIVPKNSSYYFDISNSEGILSKYIKSKAKEKIKVNNID